ncbi:hypothetical protein, partial [Yoonia sp. SDW83-1]|uniref:hypothetical protein n=1 Tax=Yoonia sp. SDW83-1 TaxID=3366945 RepID=UPI00398C3F15
ISAFNAVNVTVCAKAGNVVAAKTKNVDAYRRVFGLMVIIYVLVNQSEKVPGQPSVCDRGGHCRWIIAVQVVKDEAHSSQFFIS